MTAVGFVLLFLYTALRRMHFPFALDQIEGGMATTVWRIITGLPSVYVRPTLDFVPYLYPPLYLWLAAALGKFAGGDTSGCACSPFSARSAEWR